jgi:hypothetical protein
VSDVIEGRTFADQALRWSILFSIALCVARLLS